jgi:hypothetical protein
LSYREKAGLDAFQINFHGNRNLDQLLQSMECFMQDVAPMVSDERGRLPAPAAVRSPLSPVAPSLSPDASNSNSAGSGFADRRSF